MYLWKIIPKSIIVLVVHRMWAPEQVKRKGGNYFSEATLGQCCCSLVRCNFIKLLNERSPFMPRTVVHVVLQRVQVGSGAGGDED